MPQSDIQPFHHAVDVTWGKDSAANLYLHINEHSFSGAIFDKEKQKFIQLSSFQVATSTESILPLLDEYFPGWQKHEIFILHSGLRTSLVPEALYDSDKKAAFFGMSNAMQSNDRLYVNYLSHLQAFFISAWPAPVAYDFELAFHGAQVLHQAAPWLESLFLTQKKLTGTNTYINILDDGIYICVFKDHHLQLFNTFPCTGPEDMLYFLLFVGEQLDINPHKDQYYLSGNIKRDDSTHRLFSKYISELNFMRRPDQYEYSLTLNTLPEHQYFITYSSALCV